MRFKCDYTELLTSLEKVAVVAEDSNSSDEIKNIIFRFERQDDNLNVCTLIGVNHNITYKHILPYEKYSLELNDAELTDRVCFMQIKSKDLINFLNAYKSVRRTTVDEVTFETNADSVKINCSVLEYGTDDDKRPYISNCLFNNIPIKPNMLDSINAQALNHPIEVVKEDLKYIIKTLLPTLSNDTQLYSSINMGSDYVVAFSTSYVALMKNILAEGHIFENMRLSARSLAFLDKVICNQEDIKVAKTEKQLYIRTDRSESFIAYDSRLSEYSVYLDMCTKQHGYCVDRLLLKDVLKRLALEKDETVDVTLKPSLNVVNLRNSKYTQDIPLLKQINLEASENYGFRLSPDVLNKVFIGTDSTFSPNSYIYFTELANGVSSVVFTDDSDSWFTLARVKNV